MYITHTEKEKKEPKQCYFSFGAKFLCRRDTVALFTSTQDEQIG